MHKFEVYKDRKGGFRFRFRASNGEPMFASESYTTKASAMKAVASIKENAAGAETQDMTAEAKAEKAPAKKTEAKKAEPKAPAAKKAAAPAAAKAPAAKKAKAAKAAPAA